MRIAICFGGYAPLHRGHLDVVMRAKKEADKVLLVVCGYDGEPRGEEIGLDLNNRLDLIRQTFDKDEQIKVVSINDTHLGIDESMSLENWIIWTKEAERLCLREFGEISDLYYVSEPSYKKRLEEIGKRVVLMSKEVKVSGTLIRKNPLRYWDYISPFFKPSFSQGILITGTASEGKTTLCKDLALYFDIPWCPEYGRKYMEKNNITDDKLTLREFSKFMRCQFFGRDLSRKVWISDTDNLVTLMYAKAYSEREEMAMTPEEYLELKKIVNPIKWNKIFMLPPDSPTFVDDGIRYMPQSTMEERRKNYEVLKELMKEYGYEYEELKGNYYQNFLQVKEYIQAL